MENIMEIFLDILLDTLKTLPILYLVYLLLEWIQKKMNWSNLSNSKYHKFGPVIGALAGSIPQCGFSAASATLYRNGAITAGTAISVFLATSDEAIPVMLSSPEHHQSILWLIGVKIIIAVLFGYLFTYTVFRKENIIPHSHTHAFTPVHEDAETQGGHAAHHHNDAYQCDCCGHGHETGNIWLSALRHTLKIAIFIVVALLVVEVLVLLIGEQNLSSFLLMNNSFQPVLSALFGLVPGCGTSVLITQLYLNGSFSFGSCVAGLCSSAGFGLLLLFKNRSGLRQNLKILFCVLFAAIAAGMALHLAGF